MSRYCFQFLCELFVNEINNLSVQDISGLVPIESKRGFDEYVRN